MSEQIVTPEGVNGGTPPETPQQTDAEKQLIRTITDLRSRNRDSEAKIASMEERLNALTTEKKSMGDAAIADIVGLQTSMEAQLSEQRTAFKDELGQYGAALAELKNDNFKTKFENLGLKRGLQTKYQDFVLSKITRGQEAPSLTEQFDVIAEAFPEFFEVAPELPTRSARQANAGDVGDTPPEPTAADTELVMQVSPHLRKYFKGGAQAVATQKQANRRRRQHIAALQAGRVNDGQE